MKKFLILFLILLPLFIFAQKPQKFYFIELYYKNGEVSLTNLVLKEGFVPQKEYQGEDAWRWELWSKNALLSQGKFPHPGILPPPPPPLEGEETFLPQKYARESSFALLIPYHPQGKLVKVFDEKGNLKIEVDVSGFSQTNKMELFKKYFLFAFLVFCCLVLFLLLLRKWSKKG